MLHLLIRRIVATLATLFLVSVVAFVLIQLPPGDYVDAYAGKKTQGGVIITQDELDEMRTRLGLDRPFYRQYLMGGLRDLTGIANNSLRGGLSGWPERDCCTIYPE